ncbi:WD40 repeat-like protein [Ramicandelaber brevisporus]|nr:WD40 repeat-like protein [Ramicandelaber brevisporus]
MYRLATGSFIESNKNRIQVVSLASHHVDPPPPSHPPSAVGPSGSTATLVNTSGQGTTLDEEEDFVSVAEAELTFPPTKIAFCPEKGIRDYSKELLISSSDMLRVWELHDHTLDEPVAAAGPSASTSSLNSTSHLGRSSGNSSNNSTSSITSRVYAGIHGYQRSSLKLRSKLKNHKTEFGAPITSFDWNRINPNLVISSSIDTTCTLWDIERGSARTQLIAHDREVFDVAFQTHSTDIFASVGADGGVRLFDLRALDHSTILYEAPQRQVMAAKLTNNPRHHAPSMTDSSISGHSDVHAAKSSYTPALMRLAFNKADPNVLATFEINSSAITIIDIRQSTNVLATLRHHESNVNCLSWSPVNQYQLCSGGEDSKVFIWDLNTNEPESNGSSSPGIQPMLSYTAEASVQQVCWNEANHEYVGIVYANAVQCLRM